MVSEITAWCEEGYVCDGIWDRLRAQVNPVLLPEKTVAAPSAEENSPEPDGKLRKINIVRSASCEHVGSSQEHLLYERSAHTSSGDETTSSSVDTKPSVTPVNLKCLEDYVIPSEEGM